MAKDFEQIGHKNLELLRFYVSKDIGKIDAKIQDNESSLLGYFLGSLVDFLIVFMFSDILNNFFEKYVSSITFQMLLKTILIVGLICVFMFVSWSSQKISNNRIKRGKVSGKSAYEVSDERQEIIDNFDNIACDGLLICQNYIWRYQQVQEKYIKDFYLYEIIHHLNKAAKICNIICNNKKLYISSKDDQLLDSYRVNNFIVFSQNIVAFLVNEISENVRSGELGNDMTNLEELVKGWEFIN